jgi:hypothetical protein
VEVKDRQIVGINMGSKKEQISDRDSSTLQAQQMRVDTTVRQGKQMVEQIGQDVRQGDNRWTGATVEDTCYTVDGSQIGYKIKKIGNRLQI